MDQHNITYGGVLTLSHEEIRKYIDQLDGSRKAAPCDLGKAEDQSTNAGCEPDFDSVLCWPQTPRNTIAVLPCLEQLNGIHYDTTRK